MRFLKLTTFIIDDSIRLQHAQEALSLARELNYPNLILEAHLSIARIPFQHYSIRLKHAQQALILATQLNNFRKIDDLNRIISNITNARKRARDEDYHANVQRAGLLPTPQQPFN